MYTVVCDNCGKDVNAGGEYSCLSDADAAEDGATDSDWLTIDDKHYCPDCVSYDDDDNMVLKTIVKNKP